MEETVFDYYSGFEGDMYYIFSISFKDIIYRLDIWSGYIDTILKDIPLGEQGVLEGLALHYTMCTGLFDINIDVWTMPKDEVAISIKQFEWLSKERTYDEPFEETKDIIKILKRLFEDAYRYEGKITIEYT
jgi:hypothetical protein